MKMRISTVSILFVLLSTIPGNNGMPTQALTCSHKGKTYKEGDSFMENCNHCFCNEGIVACKKMARPIPGNNGMPAQDKIVKPGKCPVPPGDVVTPCVVLCSDDANCSGAEKCCHYGCSKQCMKPATSDKIVKPGKCPVPPADVVTPCVVLCSDDANCSGAEKCCHYGCSKQCMKPATSDKIVKLGKCPVAPVDVVTPCVVLCSDDANCPGAEKCCHYGCGTQCMEPATSDKIVKPGKCPVAPVDLVTPCVVLCSDDANCPGAEKCCHYGCGTQCMKPATSDKIVKPGKCPVAPIDLVTPCVVLCSDDANCPGAEKCCHYGCGTQCMKPATSDKIVKPGKCPVAPVDVDTPCVVLCSDDANCSGAEKCCHYGCGTQCMEPATSDKIVKPGKCPVAPVDLVTPCVVLCSDDANCPGAEKCCHYGCGTQCMKPATSVKIVKPGKCPVPPGDVVTPCVVLCSDDANCPGTEKCCHYGCGTQCMKPATSDKFVKPGKCPVPPRDVVTPCVVLCSDDANCPGAEKCCHYGCGTQCMEPATSDKIVKPGKCPVPPGDLVTPCVVLCSDDANCPGVQKCCHYGCGTQCMEPATSDKIVKPGKCPVPPADVVTPCVVLCSDDANCSGAQKCCHYGCSTQCMEPATSDKIVKPGKCPVPPADVVTPCVVLCSDDANCSGAQKCCHYGCSTQCMEPATSDKIVKPGKCPVPPRDLVTPCVVLCSDDANCPGAEKCCHHGCGTQCVKPATSGLNCFHKGETYKEGDSFMDDCNHCFCNGGIVGCTEKACLN